MARMPEEEREAWEQTRDLGAELLDAVQEMKAGKGARRFTAESFGIVRAREKVGMTQGQFAALLGVSRRTLEQWEQGRRKPNGAALTLIKIAERHPEVLQEVAA